MDVGSLDPGAAALLRGADLSYAPVGHSGTGPVPGFGWLRRSRMLSRRDFEGASRDLLTWQIQRRAGLAVRASDPVLREGTVVLMRLGTPRLGLDLPCRVVSVVEEPDRCAFAYGTLPGHAEAGEERFELLRHPSGEIELSITAYSRPASTLARLSGPLGRGVQAVMTRRYLHSLDKR
jgi:uncharacterized protein (UPF0548 family)